MTADTLFGPGFAADPYPAYARLRQSAPACRVTLPSGVQAYLITRYADAKALLADPRLSKDPSRALGAWRAGRIGLPGEQRSNLGGHLLNIDPPDHTRLRRLVAAAFTPRRIERARDRVQAVADELIDAIASRGEADLIAAVAFPLPIVVICELLGVPAEDQQRFQRWAGGMIAHAGTPRGGVGRSVRQIRAYLGELIERKQQQIRAAAKAADGTSADGPPDDLLSALIVASEQGQRLSAAEVASMAFILLFAGFETTVNLIGNGMHALLREPEQLARLRADPALLPAAVEELLRYDGPVEIATWRFATEPVRVGDVLIPAGEPVLVVLAAADRDPDRFERPDELDLGRSDNPHLAFGQGIHYCLGAPLARLEGQIAMGTLLRRLPDLRLAETGEPLRWRGGLIMRGLTRLPVRFTPSWLTSDAPSDVVAVADTPGTLREPAPAADYAQGKASGR